jgi:hypothetical protein
MAPRLDTSSWLYVGYLRSPRQRARAPLHQIVGGDACGLDPDPHLASCRLGQVLLHHLQYLRPAVPRHDHAVILPTLEAVLVLDVCAHRFLPCGAWPVCPIS